MATWVQTSQLSKILDAIKTALAKKLEASGIKNNLTTEDSGYVLDARAGKTLGDRATALETKISSLFFETDSAGRWGYKSSKNGAVTPFEATGGASTIQTANLTGNRALVSNSDGKVAVAETTATEMGYLHGVTSGVQGQINSLNSNLANQSSSISSLKNDVSSVSSATDKINLYVGSDGKLHWVNKAGADSALNFSNYSEGYSAGVAAAKAGAKIAYYPHYSTNATMGGVNNNTWTCNYCGATLGGQGQSSGVLTWGSCQTRGSYISWSV